MLLEAPRDKTAVIKKEDIARALNITNVQNVPRESREVSFLLKKIREPQKIVTTCRTKRNAAQIGS